MRGTEFRSNIILLSRSKQTAAGLLINTDIMEVFVTAGQGPAG